MHPASRRPRTSGPIFITRLTTLAGLAWLTLAGSPACSTTDTPSLPTCSQNSDCKAPSVCALGRCRPECSQSADCPDDQWCLTDTETMSAACVDRNQPCNEQADCTAPLACASDYRCRNLCDTDDDCNVLGVAGRVCVSDASGVRFCADPEDTDGRVITSRPPRNADTSQPVIPPPGLTEGGAGGAPTSGGSSTTGGTTSAGTTGGGTANGGSASGGSSTGGASIGGGAVADGGDNAGLAGAGGGGGEAPIECVPGCTQGNACVNGACVPCGAQNQACCEGTGCGINLKCNGANECACGNANEPCCGGISCGSGVSCDTTTTPGSPVCACGTPGTTCCPAVGGGAATCSVGTCAGTKCSCLAGLALGAYAGPYTALVRRTDGTLWQFPYGGSQFSQLLDPLQQPLVATDMAICNYDVTHIGCAVVGGNVWCFPGTTVNDSTFLGAGLGNGDTTSGPVQVVTSVGGPPLTGVQQISADPTSYPTFCAVGSDGSIWCWGYGNWGQLGRGDTASSKFAQRVMANANTSFTDAVEVSVGARAACARKTDGSVWCWGTNAAGEFGDSKAIASSYFPVRVPFTGSTPQTTATRLNSGANQTFCAIMQDTSVVCWGYDRYAEAGTLTASPWVAPPTTLLVANGGPALTKVIDVAGPVYGQGGEGGLMCARTSSLDVKCWGRGNPYPTTYTDAQGNGVSGIHLPLASGAVWLGYIDPAGRVTLEGTPLAVQPPCTNLLP